MPTTGELEIQIRDLDRRISDHAHDLYGNGDRGLKSRMQSAETWIAQQAQSQSRREENLQRALYTLVATLVTGVLIWAGTTLWKTTREDAALKALNGATMRLEAAAKDAP